MDMTIKQLANRLKISRPTVEVRMNHIPNFRKQYTSKHGNKIMINDLGCKLIAKTKAAPHRKRTHQASRQHDPVVLKVLHGQTANQHAIIKDQSQTIQKLTKLLDQQQQLQLSTQSENKHLKRRVKKLTHVSTQNNVIGLNHKRLSDVGHVSKPRRSKPKKTGFWSRFFGKSN